MFRVRCPQCRSVLTLEDSAAGGLADCPSCGVQLELPERKRKLVASAAKRPPRDDDTFEEDAPRERQPRKPKRPRRERAWGSGEPFMNRNRIGGFVGIGLGLLIVIGGLATGAGRQGGAYGGGQIAALVLGLALLGSGVVAVIRG